MSATQSRFTVSFTPKVEKTSPDGEVTNYDLPEHRLIHTYDTPNGENLWVALISSEEPPKIVHYIVDAYEDFHVMIATGLRMLYDIPR